jgi:pimeloyl-ACP methyl ester carboxylesterase
MWEVAMTDRHPRRARAVLAISSLVTLMAAGCGGSDEGEAGPTSQSTAEPATTTAPVVQTMVLEPCTVAGLGVRCGTLTVPEDRSLAGGRTIDLRVVVVPASGDVREPDPVVYFAGGPGGAATDDIGDMAVVMRDMNVHRDLVFVDQRGTGGSAAWSCPPADAGVDVEEDAVAATAYLTSCIAAVDADLGWYTTAMAVDDVRDVLDALGYDQVNLYGGSYGATIAQVFLRRHEDRVRTMTLSGGTLLDVPIFEVMPDSSQAALDALFARCDDDAACHAAFPTLRDDWRSLFDSVTADPVVLPADRSPDGETFTLTAEVLAGGVHELLLSADTAAQLPLIIHAFATAPDRVGFLDAYADRLAEEPAGASSDSFLLMPLAIRCAEPWATFAPDEVAAQRADSYYAAAMLENARWWEQACSVMPTAGAAAGYEPAATSDVPVLMLNGDADPQDPPANMAGASELWPNSVQIVEPGQGHQISSWACSESIVAAFVEAGTAADLDTACIEFVAPPPFAVDGPTTT